ncbi:MAG: hypothetical protein D6798_07315 [Deltaproteobacteria bacterium]|nr:MAG: hypothetical protein D6798_07315 [Deltaproteobacteria bacterium]
MNPLLIGAALAFLHGCSLFGDDKAKEAAAQAEARLMAGDLPGAADAYDQAVAEYGAQVDVATGAAFMALQRGRPADADRLLAQAEEDAGERLPEVKMRRALVAIEAGDLEAVKAHGMASGLPAGQLLAAEVALADGEREEARGLLQQARTAGGAIAELADDYLDLLDDEDPLVAGLSEAQALWALGLRKVAVKSVEEVLLNLPDSFEERDEQLLIWSGRAATERETDIARSLLDGLIFAPEGQQWRKIATSALIACADGDGATCVSTLVSLEGQAPEDGLADARATAALLIAADDPEAARKLAGPYVSSAAARALLETGDRSSARESSPGGVIGSFLEAGG